MHRINIKPKERKGPVRMEVTLQNTSRGQVQRFKYFPSSDKTSGLELREENIESTVDTGQAYAELDQVEESVPLHRRTKGKVSYCQVYFVCDSRNRPKMTIFVNGKLFEMAIFMLCLKQKPLPPA